MTELAKVTKEENTLDEILSGFKSNFLAFKDVLAFPFKNRWDNNFKLPLLLKNLETTKNPYVFKELLLRITQLYFDGLVERKMVKDWPEQFETLEAVLNSTSKAVVAVYRNNNNITCDDVREIIMPYDSKIVKYGSKKISKRRHLLTMENIIKDFAIEAVDKLYDKEIDLVIPIASGGFEPASLVADFLGIDNQLPVRFSYLAKNDYEVLLPAKMPSSYAQEQIQGKNVLVVDDFLSSGKTAFSVLKWVQKKKPLNTYLSIVNIGLVSKNLFNFSGIKVDNIKNSKNSYKVEKDPWYKW